MDNRYQILVRLHCLCHQIDDGILELRSGQHLGGRMDDEHSDGQQCGYKVLLLMIIACMV